jgi:hypothetical protein
MTKIRAGAVLAVLVLACGGEAATTSTVETPTTSLTTTTAPPPTTASPTTVTTTTGGAGVEADCLIGDWVLDLESFEQLMESAMAGAEDGIGVSVTEGGGTLAFGADGTASGGYQDLTLALDLGSEGLPVVEVILNGTVVGTWALEGETLILTPGEESSFEVSASVDGEPFPIPLDPEMVSFGSTRSEVACEGDRLTVLPEVEGAAPTVWLRA